MRVLAYLVHLYTAAGVLCALAALTALWRGDSRLTLLWLVAATFIDATDGWLARRADVHRRAALIDGARMDDIIDYLTYVVVPGLLLLFTHRLPAAWGVVVVGAMFLSSILGFSRKDAKTVDHLFTGFPSYWNIVAVYLIAAGTPPAWNAVLLLGLSALVFVPIRYVYPSRTQTLWWVTVPFCAVWSVQVLAMIWKLPDVPMGLVVSSLAFPIYYIALSFWLTLTRRAG